LHIFFYTSENLFALLSVNQVSLPKKQPSLLGNTQRFYVP
jgi:hypothetical protein